LAHKDKEANLEDLALQDQLDDQGLPENKDQEVSKANVVKRAALGYQDHKDTWVQQAHQDHKASVDLRVVQVNKVL